MPGPNPWEIIIGMSNLGAWDTKVLNHLVYITWACAGFSGLMFSLKTPGPHLFGFQPPIPYFIFQFF